MSHRSSILVTALVGTLALTTAGSPTAQQQSEQPVVVPVRPTPSPPHPSTQSPEHRVTSDQMKKWEKELSNWSRWGKDDERGTLNLITPEKTRAAVKLVKAGISVSLHRFPDLTRQVDSWSFGETRRWEFMVSWSVLRIPGGTATPFTALATF